MLLKRETSTQPAVFWVDRLYSSPSCSLFFLPFQEFTFRDWRKVLVVMPHCATLALTLHCPKSGQSLVCSGPWGPIWEADSPPHPMPFSLPLLLSSGSICSPRNRLIVWRQGVEARYMTLSRNTDGWEDRRLMSHNNHLVGVWMPGFLFVRLVFNRAEREELRK